MELFHAPNECDAVEFVIRYRPKRSIKFKRKQGIFAVWIVIAGIGELYTHKSLRKRVGHKYILTYDFFAKTFGGSAYGKEENNCR